MKRMTCISFASAIFLSALLAPSTALADEGTKESNTKPEKMLIGAWRLKAAKTPGSPSGIGTRLKLFTGTHWCVIQPDPDSGNIVFQHGGHYSFDGTVLSETIDFAGESTSSLIGRTFKHKLKISKDSLEQIDPDGVFNETWVREKAAKSK
ncbi:hypothetical protein Enr13x_05340 [Stieleria neptunia]|uniref:Lipocalin-like domain-containing protein n=1 Tax=Stieleria neptunia TaxID=2527979 RepID=A0A518HIM4_9BACT|nr:hypothetical protein [Stieleria neptunia]QDV40698.1 hypothetical protein Enr13x_05340 [Stieleria neptunia]